jgi:hypothetical protein
MFEGSRRSEDEIRSREKAKGHEVNGSEVAFHKQGNRQAKTKVGDPTKRGMVRKRTDINHHWMIRAPLRCPMSVMAVIVDFQCD